jgi:hypothetical protein
MSFNLNTEAEGMVFSSRQLTGTATGAMPRARGE